MLNLLLFITFIQTIISDDSYIFTFESNNLDSNYKIFNEDDISSLKIKLNNKMDMYSIFTKNYFNRCINYNDPYCNYTIDEQKNACLKLISDNNDFIYKMYYYGKYDPEFHEYLIHPNGDIDHINIKNKIYTILGVYVIEIYDDDDFNNMSYNQITYVYEPSDFFQKMMLYIYNDTNSSSCPYWTLKN